MLYFDFVNPYVVYLFFLFLSVFTVYAIFTYKEFITKHKKKIYLVASVLLIWTQLARYLGVLFKDGFDPLECSVVGSDNDNICDDESMFSLAS